MDPSTDLLELPTNYTAYLVRLWQDSAHGSWRASAQSVHTGEKLLFASMDALCTFLQSHTLVVPAPDGAIDLNDDRDCIR